MPTLQKITSSLLLALSISSCAGPKAEVDKATIQVSANQPEFKVSLDANPTTGYQWQVVRYDEQLLSLSGSLYQAPKTKLIGAGGAMVFLFKLKKGKKYPEETTITFKYARPWESKEYGTTHDVRVQFTPPAQ